MEAFTAFVEGPLCFVILYGMLKQKPWRFTLQFAVSLAQFYGDVLYFATSYYDGMSRKCQSLIVWLSLLACRGCKADIRTFCYLRLHIRVLLTLKTAVVEYLVDAQSVVRA